MLHSVLAVAVGYVSIVQHVDAKLHNQFSFECCFPEQLIDSPRHTVQPTAEVVTTTMSAPWIVRRVVQSSTAPFTDHVFEQSLGLDVGPTS